MVKAQQHLQLNDWTIGYDIYNTNEPFVLAKTLITKMLSIRPSRSLKNICEGDKIFKVVVWSVTLLEN